MGTYLRGSRYGFLELKYLWVQILEIRGLTHAQPYHTLRAVEHRWKCLAQDAACGEVSGDRYTFILPNVVLFSPAIRAVRCSRHYGDGYGRMPCRHRTVEAFQVSQRVRQRQKP